MQHTKTALRGEAGNVSLREVTCFSLMSSLQWKTELGLELQDKPLLLSTASCLPEGGLVLPIISCQSSSTSTGNICIHANFSSYFELEFRNEGHFPWRVAAKKNIHTFSSFWIAFLRDLAKQSCYYLSINWSNISISKQWEELPANTYYCCAHSHQLKTQILSCECQACARHQIGSDSFANTRGCTWKGFLVESFQSVVLKTWLALKRS